MSAPRTALTALLMLGACDAPPNARTSDASTDARSVDAASHVDGSDAWSSEDAAANDAAVPSERGGPVRLVGRELHDDGGPFPALGASLFWATWAYRNDRPRLERNLAWLRDHDFDFIRVLGVVGDPAAADYWDGREAEWQWPDYDDVIAGLTDLAWQTYGLRVEWTLIGDGQVSIPDEADRYALVDRFLAMSATRAEEIIHFEIANEAWQNGFDGDSGNAQLRALSVYMRDRTDILVAASASSGRDCPGITYVYGGTDEIADIATVHFDRDTTREEGQWGPVWQPATLAGCGGWVGSNNEPIGPGASVAVEDDPMRLAASVLSTWVSGLPLHVFHSGAGVRGDVDVADMPGADAFGSVHALVPRDVSGWDRRRGDEADAPLRFFAEDAGGTLVPDAYWMDVSEPPRSGVVRADGAIRGSEFVFLPVGILGTVVVEARASVAFDVHDPLSGALVSHHELLSGERATLTGTALIVRGQLR